MTDDNQPSIAEGLIQSIEVLAPFFDAAEGIKADMERRGWSPTVAEAIAHQWLTLVLNQIWKGK